MALKPDSSSKYVLVDDDGKHIWLPTIAKTKRETLNVAYRRGKPVQMAFDASIVARMWIPFYSAYQ